VTACDLIQPERSKEIVDCPFSPASQSKCHRRCRRRPPHHHGDNDPSFPNAYLSLNALESADAVQVLDRDELDGRRGCESSPHGDESTPEGQEAVARHELGRAVDESRVQLGFVRGLIHEGGADPIERRHGDRHGQSGDHAGAEVRSQILPAPAGGFRDDALGDVVHSHLGGVQNARAHDVGRDAAVESRDALLRVEGRDGRGQTRRRPRVGLRQRLEDVEGVAHEGTYAARDGTREEFHVEGG
jgi:hypothetical protein